MHLIVGIDALPGIARSGAQLREEACGAGRVGGEQNDGQAGGIAACRRVTATLQNPIEFGLKLWSCGKKPSANRFQP